MALSPEYAKSIAQDPNYRRQECTRACKSILASYIRAQVDVPSLVKYAKDFIKKPDTDKAEVKKVQKLVNVADTISKAKLPSKLSEEELETKVNQVLKTAVEDIKRESNGTQIPLIISNNEAGLFFGGMAEDFGYTVIQPNVEYTIGTNGKNVSAKS